MFRHAYDGFLNESIIKRAIRDKRVDIEIIDFRKYSHDNHQKVDDSQCGGGPGMVLSLQPIVSAIKDLSTKDSRIILTSPKGKMFNQKKAYELSKCDHIIFIAGHYEGFDERLEHYLDETYSIGDYVLTGGELPTMVMTDSIVRLIDGVINQSSLIDESFNNNLLDYPVYTRPIEFDGHKVPSVLLSGDHKKIGEYRHKQQIEITKSNRPDLFKEFLKLNKEGN